MNDARSRTAVAPRRRWLTIVAIIAATFLVVGAVAFGAWSRIDASDSEETSATGRLQSLVDAGFPLDETLCTD